MQPPPFADPAQLYDPARHPRPVEAYPMRIARDGTWFHEGRPIGRPGLVQLFASALRRGVDGRHWLVTPAEHGPIAVEVAPFVIVAMTVEGAGRAQRLHVTTNLQETVTIGPDHPLRIEGGQGEGRGEGWGPGQEEGETEEPVPLVRVRPHLDALLLRSVFYQLVDLAAPAEDAPDLLGIWSAGRFFPLGRG